MRFIYKKAFFIFVLFSVFSFNCLFCEDWFVCLGSFKVKQNAENRVTQLSKNNIQAFVYETQADGQTLYRVLLDEPFSDRNAARNQKNKLSNNAVINALGINGLWICSAERDVPAEPAPAPLVVLQENKTEEIPISEEKPYSVLVRSYKEEYAAENTKDRLVEDDIDAYVLGKFDEKELFSFDVHAGAFSSEEETEDLIEKLEEKGIEDVEIKGYDFTNQQGRRKNYRMVWFEGTGFHITALQMMSQYALKNGKKELSQQYKNQAIDILSNMEKASNLINLIDKSLPYTSKRPTDKQIFTTFANEWEIPRGKNGTWVSSSSSTGWYLIATSAFNPLHFDTENVSYKLFND